MLDIHYKEFKLLPLATKEASMKKGYGKKGGTKVKGAKTGTSKRNSSQFKTAVKSGGKKKGKK